MSQLLRRAALTFYAEENVASLAQFVFVVFLLAPPLLGFIGEYFGLRWSFALAFPFLMISLLSISAFKKHFFIFPFYLFFDTFNKDGSYNIFAKFLFTSARRSCIHPILHRWHITHSISHKNIISVLFLGIHFGKYLGEFL